MKFNTMEELAEDVKEEYSCRLDDLDRDIPFWEYSISSVNDNLDMIFENFENLGDYLKREEIDYLLYSVKLPNMTYSNLVDDFMQKKYSELMEEVGAMEISADHEAEKEHKVVCDGGISRPVKEFKPIQSVTAAELDKMEIPPIEWIVEKVLPIGLSMIGAPSKYYKSYMALGLCVAICNGGKFLGFDCNKHDCLYLDLESTKRRPKNRLNQIVGESIKKPDNLYIITGTDNPGRIGDGFEQQIEYQLEIHPKIKLIIVDVFQMIRQPAKRNQSGYDRDYEDFKVLKQIADKNGIGLMLIHHTRKMKDPSDVFNELSGSVGVMGALDCAWVITKDDRYSEEGTLHITGRDMESQKLKIRFNKKTFQWEYVGTEEDVENQRLVSEYEQSPVVETIKKLVKQNNGRWEGSASEIKDASKYLSWEIYDTPQKIGSLINKYEPLLHFDGIDFKYSRSGKTRKYIFNDTNVIDVINVVNDTNVTEQMTLDIGNDKE